MVSLPSATEFAWIVAAPLDAITTSPLTLLNTKSEILEASVLRFVPLPPSSTRNSSPSDRAPPISVAPSMSTEAASTTTFELSAVALRISVFATLRTLPDARLMFSEEPKLSPVASNWKVLLPSPELTVIPPPSAAASLAAPSAT